LEGRRGECREGRLVVSGKAGGDIDGRRLHRWGLVCSLERPWRGCNFEHIQLDVPPSLLEAVQRGLGIAQRSPTPGKQTPYKAEKRPSPRMYEIIEVELGNNSWAEQPGAGNGRKNTFWEPEDTAQASRLQQNPGK
jgi:hypothetical protein